MLETIALPTAPAPPSGDLRPSGQTPSAGEAGQTPFKDVLAAAQAAPEPEPDAAAPAPAEDPATLSAVAALLAQLFNLGPAVPVEAPAAPPAAALAAEAVGLVSQPAVAGLAAEAPPAAAPAAEGAASEFADLAAQLTTQADLAVVSADAQAAARGATPPAPRPARGLPTAAPAAESPATDGAPAVVTAQPSVHTNPLIEPARLAEAQNLTPAAQPEVVLPQVLRGVEGLVRSGATSVNLHLYPEALGRIDVQVTTNADGLRVTLTADSAATGGLLQQHLGDLRQSLNDSGLNIQALSVGIGQGQAGQQMPAWQRPPHPGSPAATPRQPTAEAAEPAPALTLAGAGTRVDYRI